MSQRLLPRQKRFAELIHAGKPISTAYVEAGYKHDKCWGNPYRLLTGNDRVKQYISDLERETRTRHDLTVDAILTDLETARLMAEQNRNPGAMITASMAQAKLCGLVVDKREIEKPIERMSHEEVVNLIREHMGDKADALLEFLELEDRPEETDGKPIKAKPRPVKQTK
jgi:phage terminase small subunit